MLEEDDFLRKIPLGVQESDRLYLEALVFSHDIMDCCLGRIFSFAKCFNPQVAVHNERVLAFGDCWSIIDQIHNSIGFLRKITRGNMAEDTASFVNDFGYATLMRNEMDHLDRNIPNRSKTTKYRDPLFGVISWFEPKNYKFDAVDRLKAVRGNYVIITGGSSTSDTLSKDTIRLSDIGTPICSLKLAAFENSINLIEATLSLQHILERISNQLKLQIISQLSASKNAGIEVDISALPRGGGHIQASIEIEFDID